MGNSGTSGADETWRDVDPDEPGEPNRPQRRGTGEGRDAAQPWGEGYTDDVAPEWPLTNENRVVETTPKPAGPASRSGSTDADRDETHRAADPERPHRPADNTAASRSGSAGFDRDGVYPAAESERPHRPADDSRGPGHADRYGTDDSHRFADAPPVPDSPAAVRPGRDETVLPVTSRPPVPGETTVLPAIGAAEAGGPRHASPDEAETSLLPGLGAETARHTGHARIPGEAEAPRGFLVAQGLSATGSDGPIFTSVSVAAERGELVAIVGDAGTGRTALLLALAGRFKFQAGSLAVDGDTRPARIRASVAIAWAPPAVVFEENHTIAAVLTESALVGGVGEAEVRRCCEELRLDLDTGAAFGQLSRVDQTLLALASAWASGAPAVAVDDLDSGVDDAGTARLWQAARRVADDGRLVLATAVRAGSAVDQCPHPRPLAPAHRGATEPLR